MRLVLVVAVLLCAAAPSWAGSPWVAEMRTWATRYHEDPARLDTLRAELTRAAARPDAPAGALLALAEACFLWGDTRARTTDDRLGAYDQGREAARRAAEIDPRSALAHFWHATNTGRWGQTRGVMRSLFLLPELKKDIDTAMRLDPGLVPVYSLAGYFAYEVPGVLGGDVRRAEQLFRTGLSLDPRFTGLRVGLAHTLVKQGRYAEARREAEAVLAETAPTNPATWTLKDTHEARALLDAIRDKG